MNVCSFGALRVAARTGLIGALLLCPTRGHAQLVRGELQAAKEGARAGVNGAVVQLLDAAGRATSASVLSDMRGAFVLRVPSPGRYFVRARRIGFQPVTSELLSIESDTSITLAMIDLPVVLPPVSTVETNDCRIHPDSALTTAALWEETKTALMAAEITRQSSPYTFDLVDHARIYDFSSGELLAVALEESNAYDTRSWASVPPEDLRRGGYVRFGMDSTAFIAPDIQTLLSTYFADTHCLRLGAHQFTADSLIGIDFEPVEKIDHVEIRGTFWLNRRTHNLSAIDFQYVNLDFGDAKSSAGGHVEFAPLATGGWILSDWAIRVPIVHIAVDHQVHPTANAGFRRRMRNAPTILESRNRIVPDQLRVAGGTLRAVLRDSVRVWSPPEYKIDVHVTTGPSRHPLAANEAFANLVGTSAWVHTDSAGVVAFSGVVRGNYLIDVSTNELDVLGWPRARVRVDVGATRDADADVQLASSLAAARAVCEENVKLLNESTGVIIGSVKAGSRPIADRAVTLSWLEQPESVERNSAKRISRTVRTLSGDGRYIACGVPRDRDVVVHVDGQDVAHDKTVRIALDRVVAMVDMPVDR